MQWAKGDTFSNQLRQTAQRIELFDQGRGDFKACEEKFEDIADQDFLDFDVLIFFIEGPLLRVSSEKL